MEIEIATIFLSQNETNKVFKKYYFIKNTCKIELKTGKNESGMRN